MALSDSNGHVLPTVIMLLGWNLHQWGIAIQRFGWAPLSLDSAFELRKQWCTRNPSQPGEIRLIGVDVLSDYLTAASMFTKLLNNRQITWY